MVHVHVNSRTKNKHTYINTHIHICMYINTLASSRVFVPCSSCNWQRSHCSHWLDDQVPLPFRRSHRILVGSTPPWWIRWACVSRWANPVACNCRSAWCKMQQCSYRPTWRHLATNPETWRPGGAKLQQRGRAWAPLCVQTLHANDDTPPWTVRMKRTRLSTKQHGK